MIEFRLEPGSGVATYIQIVQQVKQALRLGRLGPGDQLPTVKEVVSSLVINPNTVLKAYRELEREGLVGGRPGQGTFVLRTLGSAPPQEQAALRRELVRWIQRALQAGIDTEGIRALVTETVHETLREGVA
jgi:GntR family transcriptional regulator